MVALLAWLVWGGLALEGLGLSAEAFAAYGQHKAVGMLALILALVRLALRLVLGGAGGGEVRLSLAALWVQRALYGLMLIYPLSGYFLHAAQGRKAPLELLGWRVPDMPLGSVELWAGVHGACLWALGAVLALHLAGAVLSLHKVRRILPF